MHCPSFFTLKDDEKRELWALLALQHTPFFTPLIIKKMLDFYGTAHNAIKALASDSTAWRSLGIYKEAIASFLQEKWLEKAQHVWKNLATVPEASILMLSSKFYPPLLAAINNPPPVLFCLGNPLLLNTPSLAVIGNRKASTAGKNFTFTITKDLVSYGFTIVSGLAEGIDTAAHSAALDAEGNTIAVLAHGLDTVYPPKNKALFHKIAEKGCLLTEHPPLTPIKPAHFPVRNRIISALSLGVLVTEAQLQSGSLTTVRIALEQGKTIFAVPNALTSLNSTGTAYLIAEGATPAFCADEIFMDLLPQIDLETIPQAVQQALHTYHLSLYKTHENYYEKFLASLPDTPQQEHSFHTTQQQKSSHDNIPQHTTTNKKTSHNTTATETQQSTPQQLPPNLSTTALDVLNLLQHNNLSFDAILQTLNLESPLLMSELILLEIQGLITKIPGGFYQRIK